MSPVTCGPCASEQIRGSRAEFPVLLHSLGFETEVNDITREGTSYKDKKVC